MRPAPRALPTQTLGEALPIAGFALVVALAGRFEIPFVPVPLTLQTLAAMGAGLALSPRRGALAVAVTVLAGAAGAPAFSGGGAGIAHLVGPTGGYLWGLPALAAGYGLAARRLWIAPLASFAHLAFGALWLALFVGPARAVAVGLAPFLLGEAVKGVVALATYRTLARER